MTAENFSRGTRDRALFLKSAKFIELIRIIGVVAFSADYADFGKQQIITALVPETAKA